MSEILGRRIRRAREREGLTQQALADKVGVTQGSIASWEAGKPPKKANMSGLQEVLGPLSMKKASKSSGAQDEKAPTTPDSEISSFGIWLRAQRSEQSLSVPELAKSADVSAPAIYNIESGKIQNPQAATRDRLAKALKQSVPEQVVTDTEQEQAIVGLGSLTDFQPYEKDRWPQCAGVYVLYDINQRPLYVGKAERIATRLHEHLEKLWFRSPIVEYASYIEVADKQLRHQLEQVMIKFLKSNAVLNKQSAEKFD
jgi:transcriptional regulator with XRE-family HTH domain